ncbi:MAG TPA: DUF3311 domain-containing protein [Gammaproteobacteria bacterium]|jgi:hypothetical protein|nr:DUF3311 domain-containing protein [Gammaproteobacteria bacterium]
MRRVWLLALIPFIALVGGAFFANRVEPYVLGLPFFMFWIVLWVVLSSLVMAIVYRLDPRNRAPDR